MRWMGNDAGMSFVGRAAAGHAVVMDGALMPVANLGLRPMRWCSPELVGAPSTSSSSEKGRHAGQRL